MNLVGQQVVVHPNVDLDAVSCIIAAGGGLQVKFVPAGAKALPADVDPAARVLDHPLGEKGRLDADGTRHAAALAMPETSGWDPALLAEIDEQDSTGLVKSPRFSLAKILAGVKMYLGDLNRKVGGKPAADEVEWIDRQVIMAMRPVIEGLNLLHQATLAAREKAASVKVIETRGGLKIAVPGSGDVPMQVAQVLNEEMGCVCQVYQDGYNLGVFRYPGRTSPDLRKLEGKLPGWFIHTAGFLACWGSKKSPATGPATSGPKDLGELLTLVAETF